MFAVCRIPVTKRSTVEVCFGSIGRRLDLKHIGDICCCCLTRGLSESYIRYENRRCTSRSRNLRARIGSTSLVSVGDCKQMSQTLIECYQLVCAALGRERKDHDSLRLCLLTEISTRMARVFAVSWRWWRWRVAAGKVSEIQSIANHNSNARKSLLK